MYVYVICTQGLNNKKSVPADTIILLLNNLADYMNCISLETSAPMWNSIVGSFEIFLRKLYTVLLTPFDPSSLLKIMISLLKVSGINNYRVRFYMECVRN
jgi:hypothetical protein